MYNVQVVIGLAELTAVKQHLRYFFDGDIAVRLVQTAVKGAAGDNQVFALLHGVLDGVQIGAVQVASGHKEIAVFIAHGLLPEQAAVRLITETLM